MTDPADLDVTALRNVLGQQRDRIREQVEGLAKAPELGSAQGFGKRIGDGTIEAVSRLTGIGVGSALEHGLERLDRALAKLDDGSYGVCDRCGQDIAPARLDAMPDSVFCITCAALQPPPPPPPRR